MAECKTTFDPWHTLIVEGDPDDVDICLGHPDSCAEVDDELSYRCLTGMTFGEKLHGELPTEPGEYRVRGRVDVSYNYHRCREMEHWLEIEESPADGAKP